MDLTKRQQEIFDFIKRYSDLNGYPPTVRDIGKAVGLASSSTVHAHLANLEKLGLLRRDPTKPRAIELLDRAAAGVRGFVRSGLPLVGQVAAGQPILAEENIEEYVATPPAAGGEDGEFLLAGAWRVDEERRASSTATSWSSSRRTRRRTARSWSRLSATRRPSSASFEEADHIRLQPENDTMEPIRARDVRILGRVVGSDAEHVMGPLAALAMPPDRSAARSPATAGDGGPTLDDLIVEVLGPARRRRGCTVVRCAEAGRCARSTERTRGRSGAGAALVGAS